MDKDNHCFIYPWILGALVKEVMNYRNDILLNHEPEDLVEFSIESIRAWGLCGIDELERPMNFMVIRNVCKGHILLMSNARIQILGEREGPWALVMGCGLVNRLEVSEAMVRDITLARQSYPLIIKDGNDFILSVENFCSSMEDMSVPVTLREPSNPSQLSPKLIDMLDF